MISNVILTSSLFLFISVSEYLYSKYGSTKSANQLVGKRYTLKIGNLSQALKEAGKNTLDYSGVLSVAVKSKLQDTSGLYNKQQTITVGVNIDGINTDETPTIVDTVKPEWELVEEIEAKPLKEGESEARVKIKGIDTYYESDKIAELEIGTQYSASNIKDKIKIYVDGEETTTGINVTVEAKNILKEYRSINGNSKEYQYGVEYTIKVTGYNPNCNQVKIEAQAGTIQDTSGNMNEKKQIIIYNSLKTTQTENGDTGFLGNTAISRKKIGKIIFETKEQAMKREYAIKQLGRKEKQKLIAGKEVKLSDKRKEKED